MIKTIPLALPDKTGRIIRQELDRVLRLDITQVGLAEKLGLLLARQGGIAHQAHLILLTVQLRDIKAFPIRAPSDIRQVFLLRQPRLEPNGRRRLHIIDPDRHLMTFHTSHRITDRLGCRATGIDIHQRVGSHHTLVHPIKGQGRSVRRPEGAFADPELPLMNRLSTDDPLICFTCNRNDRSIGRKDEQVVRLRKGHTSRSGAKIVVASPIPRIVGDNLPFPEIKMQPALITDKSQYRTILIRHGERGQRSGLLQARGSQGLVQISQREKQPALFPRLTTDHRVSPHIKILIPTPRQLLQVARDETVISLTTRYQVGQGQDLLLCLHNHG